MDVPFCAGGYGGKYPVSNKNFIRKTPQEGTFCPMIVPSLYDSLFYLLFYSCCFISCPGFVFFL